MSTSTAEQADLKAGNEHSVPPLEGLTSHGHADTTEKGVYPPHNGSDTQSFTSDDTEAQAGVKRIEAISTAWNTKSLALSYIALIIVANVTSLEVNSTYLLVPFATSSFLAHSLTGVVYVIQSIVNAIIKLIMAKIADSFGRFESFSIAFLLYTLGYIQQAASNNVRTFAAAQIFYSAGSQGLQVLQQIFAADTSDLLNRALFSTLFDIPFLWTVWAGPEITQSILKHTTWRWGYGIWAIILPTVAAPFLATLWWNQRKAKKMGILPQTPLSGMSPLDDIKRAIWRSTKEKKQGPYPAGPKTTITTWQGLKKLWFELDVFGLVLLSAALSLILLPLSLANGAKGKWTNGSMIAMLVVGGVTLLVFPFWERSKKLAPHAFFPKELFASRTVLAGIAIGFFYFMGFYLSVFPYFSTYLIVVQGKSVVATGHITQTFSFTSTVASIVVSFIIKYTAHYKYFITLGGCIYLLGMGLLIRYREQGVSTGTLVGCQIAIGIGGGMLNVPAQLGVQAAVKHQNVAAATAVFLAFVEIGGAVGNAISSAIWTGTLPRKLAEYLPAESKAQAPLIYGNITLASSGWERGTPQRIAIDRAYQETTTTLLIVACCVVAPIIPLSLLMRNFKLDKMNQHVKGNVVGHSDGPVDGETSSVAKGNGTYASEPVAASRGGRFAFLKTMGRKRGEHDATATTATTSTL